jgi:hypothetical protein
MTRPTAQRAQPGGIVTIDPRLVRLLAINLLDEEPVEPAIPLRSRRTQLVVIGPFAVEVRERVVA